MNKVFLSGSLIMDPIVRTTSSGKKVAHTVLAVKKPIRKKEERKEGEKDSIFIPIVLWDRNAENAEEYLKKGRRILVIGRLNKRSHGKNNTTYYVTEVICESFEFADSYRKDEQTATTADEPAKEIESPEPATESQPIEDDLDVFEKEINEIQIEDMFDELDDLPF